MGSADRNLPLWSGGYNQSKWDIWGNTANNDGVVEFSEVDWRGHIGVKDASPYNKPSINAVVDEYKVYYRRLNSAGQWFIQKQILNQWFPFCQAVMWVETNVFGFFLIFVGPRYILWGHWLPLFWTSCDPLHGFQSQDGSLTCSLTCLHVVNLRVMSGATPVFSTNINTV